MSVFFRTTVVVSKLKYLILEEFRVLLDKKRGNVVQYVLPIKYTQRELHLILRQKFPGPDSE